jgi:hypothetical protein
MGPPRRKDRGLAKRNNGLGQRRQKMIDNRIERASHGHSVLWRRALAPRRPIASPAPVVAVSVWYNVGSKHEPDGKTGFAHLFEHLMYNGSENADDEFFVPVTPQRGSYFGDRGTVR